MTLWRTVHESIYQRILKGDFEEGFPGELALAEEYEVSRATIRKALTPLRERGLVSAARGRNSEVNSLSGTNVYGPVYSLFAAVEASGMSQRNRILRAEMCTHASAAERLKLDPNAELVCIERVRLADGEAIACDVAWFPGDATCLLEVDLESVALYDVLARECGITITRGEETMHAVVLNEAEARSLEAESGEAAFSIQRRAFAGERPVEWRETLVRGEKFAITHNYP